MDAVVATIPLPVNATVQWYPHDLDVADYVLDSRPQPLAVVGAEERGARTCSLLVGSPLTASFASSTRLRTSAGQDLCPVLVALGRVAGRDVAVLGVALGSVSYAANGYAPGRRRHVRSQEPAAPRPDAPRPARVVGPRARRRDGARLLADRRDRGGQPREPRPALLRRPHRQPVRTPHGRRGRDLLLVRGHVRERTRGRPARGRRWAVRPAGPARGPPDARGGPRPGGRDALRRRRRARLQRLRGEPRHPAHRRPRRVAEPRRPGRVADRGPAARAGMAHRQRPVRHDRHRHRHREAVHAERAQPGRCRRSWPSERARSRTSC